MCDGGRCRCILNLALVFGATVIFPQGLSGRLDLFSAALAALAFIALYRFKTDVLWVVIVGGAIGFLRAFLFPS